ncbi:MAG: 4-hydroxy-tetrahydrodipicolinate reductase [Muribaculaceae bacterium]|nr:4-hydroxy-tetrahydrodipicolinate reductase [Muribaculaceae bacterium]MDE7143723.1 4-hydroxy-tetrahydrodipicolinate reductase [Muribaculaceae bacterium]
MKIALIGHGKMGRAIERIALERGHDIVAVVDVDSESRIDSDEFRQADVAIEFSIPAAAEANVRAALAEGVPVVCGTTGWAEGLERLKESMPQGSALMWSGNYSLGVNLFFAANRFLARIMARFPQYRPDITEVHHIHKLDHPSGTALMAADQIIAEMPAMDGWSEEPAGDTKLLINHERHGEVPGVHRVVWDSPIDSISLEHSAKSREGFALGAVLAAEWLPSHKGFHPISDMMDEIIGGLGR